MCIMNGNLVNGLTFTSSVTNTHKDGVGAMVYAPNVGGTQIYPDLETCHNVIQEEAAESQREFLTYVCLINNMEIRCQTWPICDTNVGCRAVC